ncbi:MAG TPA: ATP-binding protein [Gaiellales bacterium]|jgi:serine/threonine-protein kinase RsbW
MSHSNEGSAAGFQQNLAAVPSSLALVRRELDRLLARQRVSPARVADVRLAVTEACANAVVHAYGDGETGTVRVTAEIEQETLVVTVRDYGGSIAARRPPAVLGMELMRALADGVSIEAADPGMAVRLEFRL